MKLTQIPSPLDTIEQARFDIAYRELINVLVEPAQYYRLYGAPAECEPFCETFTPPDGEVLVIYGLQILAGIKRADVLDALHQREALPLRSHQAARDGLARGVDTEVITGTMHSIRALLGCPPEAVDRYFACWPEERALFHAVVPQVCEILPPEWHKRDDGVYLQTLFRARVGGAYKDPQ